jgi:hypothetical protein
VAAAGRIAGDLRDDGDERFDAAGSGVGRCGRTPAADRRDPAGLFSLNVPRGTPGSCNIGCPILGALLRQGWESVTPFGHVGPFRDVPRGTTLVKVCESGRRAGRASLVTSPDVPRGTHLSGIRALPILVASRQGWDAQSRGQECSTWNIQQPGPTAKLFLANVPRGTIEIRSGLQPFGAVRSAWAAPEAGMSRALGLGDLPLTCSTWNTLKRAEYRRDLLLSHPCRTGASRMGHPDSW